MIRYITPLLFLAACGSQPTETQKVDDAPEAEVQAAEAQEPGNDANEWASFGETITLAEVVTAADLFKDPSTYMGEPHVFEGRVADVCQKAGCWMVISHQDKTMRVRMKGHDFAVAKDGTGSLAQIQGEVVSIELNEADVEHFRGESEKPEVMPEDKVEEGTKVIYELLASGVRMKKEA